MKYRDVIREFQDIKEDYRSSRDIMNEEDDRTRRVKEIINTKLSIVDKTLILLYIDCQSTRKLGKRLGISHNTCFREIKRIKNIILKEYEKLH